MKIRTLLFFVMMCLVSICSTQAETYENPIVGENAPDPSIIKGNDGYYYLFSTAEHVYRSKNLTKWNYVRQVFDGGTRPTFVEGVNVYWAPCVTRQDGRYVLYFALSKWGGEDTASIGVATADKVEGPYTIVGDGKLFTSSEVGVKNSIDPNYIEENGHKYIVWGSWHGIWLIELTEDGLAVKNVKRKRQIASTRFEAPYIYKRGRYFYLFCSIGTCCDGENSTYETVVGRSTSLFGPYVSKDNKRMLDNEYTLFLTSNEICIAPGHNSRIIEDENGTTWMSYHGYLRSNVDKGRVAWLDEVKWDEEGWPYIEGRGASSGKQEGPVVSPFSLDVDEVHAEWGVEQGTLVPVDLTGSGTLDLLLAGQRADAEQAAVPWNTLLRQDAQGTWTEVATGLQAGLCPSVTPADLDGDRQLELLVLSTPNETHNPAGAANGIYKVQSDGSLRQSAAVVEGVSFSDLTAATVADVNRDGLPDIIAVGANGKNVVLMAQRSVLDGTFAYQAQPFADESVTYCQVYVADFSCNGLPDIFACSPTSAELFLLDSASGTFQPTNWMATNPLPADGGVTFADVNNDSFFDILCTGSQAVVCLNDGTGHFAPSASSGLAQESINGNNSVTAAHLFDWNGDGFADFFYQGEDAATGLTTGALWLGSAKGVFTHERRYGAGSRAATAFLDWNADGAPDLVTAGTTNDGHLFPRTTGTLMAVHYNPSSATLRIAMVLQLESNVDGNKVRLSWKRGLQAQTYELFVRDDQGRYYGNCRAYTEGDLNGVRKVVAHGNCGTTTEVFFQLPAGHYTWGVQRVNARCEGSAFACREFTIEADGISQEISTAGQRKTPERYNLMGQRVAEKHRGIQLLRFADGSSRKTFVP